jgi:hypothetical protein
MSQVRIRGVRGGRVVEKIEEIIKTKQPDTYKKLNKKRKKRRGKNKEHLSFSDIDRLMRERTDIDERKCQGR